jgi:DNA modification methylase
MNLGRSCMQVELSLKLFEEEQKKHLANTPFNKV